ncbi:MAG: hypothetical protein FJY55_12915 [Betaproteobacteria bacterium]|nr:hypothetical protein [Betaproteobacteria bacterium]
MNLSPEFPQPPGANGVEERPWGGDPRVWAGAFMLWLLFYAATAYLLEVLSVFVIFAVVFTGLAGLAVSGLAWKRQGSRRAVLSIIIILAAWCVWIYAPVRDLGMWVRYYIEVTHYQEALAALTARHEPRCHAEERCGFDAGPPPRAVFSWGGLGDNWLGVVVDPTGTIADVERNRAAFGGRLLGCRPLGKVAFLCSFT